MESYPLSTWYIREDKKKETETKCVLNESKPDQVQVLHSLQPLSYRLVYANKVGNELIC